MKSSIDPEPKKHTKKNSKKSNSEYLLIFKPIKRTLNQNTLTSNKGIRDLKMQEFHILHKFEGFIISQIRRIPSKEDILSGPL